jgi:hypothetical protein
MLAILLLIPVVLVYFLLAYGFVLSQLWLWFVVPLGVVPISILQACGLLLVVSCTIPKSDIYKKKEEVDSGKLIGWYITPWFTYLIGYCVHYFM